MKTDDLISKLSAELKPIQTIENPYIRFIKWLLASAFIVASGIALMGVREDWRIVFNSPALLAQNIIIFLNVIGSATAALVLSVPGNEKKTSTRLIILFPILMWTLLLVIEIFFTPNFHPGNGFHCIADILLFGALPTLFLFYLVQRGAALKRGYAGLFILMSSAAMGAWAIQFTCHNDHPAHIFLWHYLPTLLLGLIGVKLGKRFIKRI